jgi:hypothetical protein
MNTKRIQLWETLMPRRDIEILGMRRCARTAKLTKITFTAEEPKDDFAEYGYSRYDGI